MKTTTNAVRPTRFAALGYRQDGRALWRIYDRDGDHAVGPFYTSKAELMGDLGRYAAEYGCDDPATGLAGSLA